jgi:hypothetical protein
LSNITSSAGNRSRYCPASSASRPLVVVRIWHVAGALEPHGGRGKVNAFFDDIDAAVVEGVLRQEGEVSTADSLTLGRRRDEVRIGVEVVEGQGH